VRRCIGGGRWPDYVILTLGTRNPGIKSSAARALPGKRHTIIISTVQHDMRFTGPRYELWPVEMTNDNNNWWAEPKRRARISAANTRRRVTVAQRTTGRRRSVRRKNGVENTLTSDGETTKSREARDNNIITHEQCAVKAHHHTRSSLKRHQKQRPDATHAHFERTEKAV